MQAAYQLACSSCSTPDPLSARKLAHSWVQSLPAGTAHKPQALALHRFKKDQSRGRLVFVRAALKICKPHQELERCSLVPTISYGHPSFSSLEENISCQTLPEKSPLIFQVSWFMA